MDEQLSFKNESILHILSWNAPLLIFLIKKEVQSFRLLSSVEINIIKFDGIVTTLSTLEISRIIRQFLNLFLSYLFHIIIICLFTGIRQVFFWIYGIKNELNYTSNFNPYLFQQISTPLSKHCSKLSHIFLSDLFYIHQIMKWPIHSRNNLCLIYLFQIKCVHFFS